MAEKYYRNICFFKNVSTIKSIINMGQFLWFTKKTFLQLQDGLEYKHVYFLQFKPKEPFFIY